MQDGRLSPAQRLLLFCGLLSAIGVGVLVNPSLLNGKGLFLAGAVVGGSAFLLLLVRETEAAMLILLAGRASLDLVANRRIGPLNVAAALGLLVIAAAALYLWGNRTFPGPQSPIFPYLLFLVIATLSLVASPDRMGGVRDLFRFISLPAVYVLVEVIGRSEKGMRRVVAAIALSGVGPVLFAFLQYTTGVGMHIKQGEFVRVIGTFLHPNPFALYLALVIPVLVAAWLTVREWRVWLGIIIVGLVAALVLTFTRTGWIGLAAAVLVMAFLRYRKILFVLPIILAAVLFLIPSIGARFADLGSSDSPSGTTTNSLDWRYQYWQEALHVVTESPVWGKGISYIKETTEEGKEAHNDFVRVVVETGLLGLALFVWAIVRVTRSAFVAVRERGSPLRQAVRVAFAGTMVAYVLMSLTSNLISQPAVQWYFWSIMALAIGTSDLPPAAAGGEDDSRRPTEVAAT